MPFECSWASFREILPLHTIEELRDMLAAVHEMMIVEEGGLGGPPTPVPSGGDDGSDDGGGEPEAALPVDPAPVVAAVLDALPAFEADGSDDSERGGDDEFNDMCEVPASEAAEMMGWDTYDDDYVGS